MNHSVKNNTIEYSGPPYLKVSLMYFNGARIIQNLILIYFLLFSVTAYADLHFKTSFEGDHYIYTPNTQAKNILVIAHGMYKPSDLPKNVAKRYIQRWQSVAEEQKLIVIAPVFDDARFGTLSQGYGGYRNLFGKYQAADKFVNQLVNVYSANTTTKSKQFYLYGHSAGGQFTNRFVVTHPNKIIKAVVSAAGRYSYPNKLVKWPYGAGNLIKTIKWDNGAINNKVYVEPNLLNYAQAANKVSIVIGALDIKKQPKRPGHSGHNRIAIAKSWASEMNKNAKMYRAEGVVTVKVIPGIGHDSKKLTPYCAKALFDTSSL